MSSEQTAILEPQKMQGLGGMYLTFYMQSEQYGIEILKIQEIIQMMSVTPIPRTPEFVKGVINLRGKVIPVIDLRLKFNMPAVFHGDQTCIIIIDLGSLNMGVIIDRVSEVVDFTDEQIDRTPSFGVRLNTEFIRGIGKTDDQVTVLMDIEHVLTDTELMTLAQLNQDDPNGAESEPVNEKRDIILDPVGEE